MEQSMKKQKNEIRHVTGEEQARMMNAFLDEAIKPHVDIIAPIVIAGDVAVIVHKPSASAARALHELGWNGSAPAFQLRSEDTERIAESCARMGDEVTGRWLRSGRQGRMFVFWGDGTLLINHAEGQGFSLEPGSTNAGWMN
jgi:hypothetical protein